MTTPDDISWLTTFKAGKAILRKHTASVVDPWFTGSSKQPQSATAEPAKAKDGEPPNWREVAKADDNLRRYVNFVWRNIPTYDQKHIAAKQAGGSGLILRMRMKAPASIAAARSRRPIWFFGVHTVLFAARLRAGYQADPETLTGWEVPSTLFPAVGNTPAFVESGQTSGQHHANFRRSSAHPRQDRGDRTNAERNPATA